MPSKISLMIIIYWSFWSTNQIISLLAQSTAEVSAVLRVKARPLGLSAPPGKLQLSPSFPLTWELSSINTSLANCPLAPLMRSNASTVTLRRDVKFHWMSMSWSWIASTLCCCSRRWNVCPACAQCCPGTGVTAGSLPLWSLQSSG